MTNLPITTSTPQAAPAGKQTANAADNNGETSARPFGEVLARQISTPEVKDAKLKNRLALELGAAETGDIKKDDKALPEAAALPVDMLALLMPQTVNTAAAPAAAAATATTTETDTASASAAMNGVAVASSDKPARTAPVADPAAPKQVGETEKTAPDIAAAPQAKESSFAAAMGEMAMRAATNAGAGARDTAIAAVTAAPQQPSAAALGAIQNPASIAAPAIQAAQVKVDTPVGQQRWGDEFGQKITWLASSKMDQTAELHLNPPQLGPLDVVIKVSGDQATALFTSPHASVREAVEQAIPKLRDMMADNGITLGNTTVSDQTPRDQGKPETQRSAPDTDNEPRNTLAVGSGSARVSPIARHNGIVDTFA